MNDITADMSRVGTTTRSPQSKAPQVNIKVSEAAKPKAAEPVSSNPLPQTEDTESVKKAKEPDAKSVADAVSKLNEFVQTTARTLNFQVDDDSGKTVIKVYDKESEKLIRQIPSELALELARKLSEEEPSLLFTAQV